MQAATPLMRYGSPKPDSQKHYSSNLKMKRDHSFSAHVMSAGNRLQVLCSRNTFPKRLSHPLPVSFHGQRLDARLTAANQRHGSAYPTTSRHGRRSLHNRQSWRSFGQGRTDKTQPEATYSYAQEKSGFPGHFEYPYWPQSAAEVRGNFPIYGQYAPHAQMWARNVLMSLSSVDEVDSGGVSVEGSQIAPHDYHSEHRATCDTVSLSGSTDQAMQNRAYLLQQDDAYSGDMPQRHEHQTSTYGQFPSCFLSGAIPVPQTQGSPYHPQIRTGVHRNVVQPFLQQSRQRGAWSGSRRRPSANSNPTEPLPRQPLEYTISQPIPTTAYLEQARAGMVTRSKAQQLLVILDLNGTLLCRPQKSRTAFVKRPGVDKFLDYLFANHKVMVWSSARPENVEAICTQLLSDEQFRNLVAIWARDTLRLTPQQYIRRTQVYKQLAWVWQDRRLQAEHSKGRIFSQANTVLIDDSLEKARSEPHNLLQIEEFVGRPDQLEKDVLGQVVEYLEWVKMHSDVSTCVYEHPWVFDPRHTAVWPAQ